MLSESALIMSGRQPRKLYQMYKYFVLQFLACFGKIVRIQLIQLDYNSAELGCWLTLSWRKFIPSFIIKYLEYSINVNSIANSSKIWSSFKKRRSSLNSDLKINQSIHSRFFNDTQVKVAGLLLRNSLLSMNQKPDQSFENITTFKVFLKIRTR